MKHPRYKKELNKDALNFYCYLGYIPGELSIFKSINKLLPSHILNFTKSGSKINRYFGLQSNKNVDGASLDDLLRKSVVSQLHADVPVGVFLSGGLDSSLVSYYITESKKKQVDNTGRYIKISHCPSQRKNGHCGNKGH